jgi:hypothetical protein
VIHEVDEALRRLVERELSGSGVEIAFDAPNREWASRRSSPTVDLYLYDIREDRQRRNTAQVRVRGEDGFVVARKQPPRMFKLSYLVTAWTQRPEDEHRVLSSVLACMLRFQAVPEELLTGSLVECGLDLPLTVALPPPEDRALSDIWSALGGELKPSLDLVITAPIDPSRAIPAGPPVMEQPRIAVDGEQAPTRGRRRGAAPADERPRADEVRHAGAEGRPGRTIRVRDAT